MSTDKLRLSRRDSLLVVDEECFSLEECLDDDLDDDFSLSEECFDDELDLDLEDFSDGTSRMFRTRPVVGSVVDDCAGSWET